MARRDTFNVLKLRCFIAVVQGSYLKKLGAYFFRLKITEYSGRETAEIADNR